MVGVQVALVVKNLPADAGDTRDAGSIPGLGRSPGGGNGNLLQYSCLGNPMDRGARWATLQSVTKRKTRLRDGAHTSHFTDYSLLEGTVLRAYHLILTTALWEVE